jgi:hypothetical protein
MAGQLLIFQRFGRIPFPCFPWGESKVFMKTFIKVGRTSEADPESDLGYHSFVILKHFHSMPEADFPYELAYILVFNGFNPAMD